MTDVFETSVIGLLSDILVTLKAMKQQEKDYWDTWKKAKETEQNTFPQESSTNK